MGSLYYQLIIIDRLNKNHKTILVMALQARRFNSKFSDEESVALAVKMLRDPCEGSMSYHLNLEKLGSGYLGVSVLVFSEIILGYD